MTEKEKCVLWVMGAMCQLRDWGLLKAPPHLLTPAGVSVFDQLDASGYRPSKQQLEDCINNGFAIKASRKCQRGIILLLDAYRVDRSNFENSLGK